MNTSRADNMASRLEWKRATLSRIKALKHPNFASWKWGIRRELSRSPESRHEEDIHHIADQKVADMDTFGKPFTPCAESNSVGLRAHALSILEEEFARQLHVQPRLAGNNMRPRSVPGPSIISNEAFREQLGPQYLSSTTNVATNPPPGFPPNIARAASYPSRSRYPQPSFNPIQLPQTSIVQPCMSESQSSSMTSRNIQPHRDVRDRISSSDFAVLAERAARRNASGSFEPKVNTSEGRESHLSHDTFGMASPSPQIITQYATYNPNSESASPVFALQQTPTRAERAVRPRNLNRGLGYDLGLDSNMPSQIPRNSQEAAAAARQHASRVRAMQRTLASDPNVMMPRAGPPSQLVAMGPPLTGHNTQTATTLPSVLNPISRQPMMTYKQGLQAIIAETGPLLLRLTQLDPRPVSVVLYDPLSRPLNVSEGLILTKECDVKAVVTTIQELLDETCDKDPTHDGSRLIVSVIDIRVGVTDGTQGYPPLKGICVQGERGQWAKWVKWATHGDMEKYWEAYRTMLQTQAPQKGSINSVAKPIFKVTTVRQLNNNGSFLGGHEFYDVSDHVPPPPPPPPPPAIVAYGCGAEDISDRFESSDGGADTSSEISAGSFAFRSDSSSQTAISQGNSESSSQASFGQGFGQLPLFDGAASNLDSRSGGSRSDGGDVPEAAKPKEKPKPVDPTKNWGYYQRMGGDPRMHKLYDLSHVPFDVDPENLPAPKYSFTTPDILVTIRDAWSDNGTEGSITPKASADGRTSWEYVEKAWREVAAKELEKAISFEDDGIFFPNANIKLPAPNHLLSSRLSGQSKQTGNTKDASHFFNDHCAPDGSQDHLLGVPSYDIPIHSGQGMANEAGDNTSYSVYAAPDSSHNSSFGVPGYEVPSHDGKGKSKQVDDEVSNQYLAPNYGQMSNQSKGKSPQTKVSSMNVHAAPFPNFNSPQIGQGSSNNRLSPYLQSLAGSQPAAYTQSIPYGPQARSSTPLLQYGSPSLIGNQAVSIKKSTSALALQALDFKPNFSSQAFYSQTSSASTGLSPEPKFSSSNEHKSPRYVSPEKSMFTSAGAFSAPRYNFPDKTVSFNTASYEHRRRSPDKEHTQKSSRRRQKSPEKSKDAAVLRPTSPNKSNTQQGFVAGAHFFHTTGAGSSMLPYPSADNSNNIIIPPVAHQNHPTLQQSLGPSSGFQYGQNAQYSFKFNFQVPGQGLGDNGGQGAMQSGVQGPSNTGGQGLSHNGAQGQYGGGQVADQTGGQGSGHSRGGSWIYRGDRLPKREFGF